MTHRSWSSPDPWVKLNRMSESTSLVTQECNLICTWLHSLAKDYWLPYWDLLGDQACKDYLLHVITKLTVTFLWLALRFDQSDLLCPPPLPTVKLWYVCMIVLTVVGTFSLLFAGHCYLTIMAVASRCFFNRTAFFSCKLLNNIALQHDWCEKSIS